MSYVKTLLIGSAFAVSLSHSPAIAATTSGLLPAGWTGVGNAGSGTADGSVTAAPYGDGGYTYVSTASGLSGVGGLAGIGGTNGSTLTTSLFAATAGDSLEFFFNYVTTDGAGFADYAWARLLDGVGEEVAILFTARTTPEGITSPGFGMPDPVAVLDPVSAPIVAGAPTWSAVGSGCWSVGCGYTGWVSSTYEITLTGNYQLQFGVTNWDDTQFNSGLAIAGATVGGVPIDPSAVPLPAAGWALAAALGGLAALRRRKTA